MTEDIFDNEDIEFIEEPLLTEGGYINEACINALSKAISNIPKTYERLSEKPEWNIKRMTFITGILGSFAQAVFQTRPGSDGKAPLHFEEVINYLGACLVKEVKWEKFEKMKFLSLSLCDINKLLYDILYEQGISYFDEWNNSKGSEGENWISLDALLHNTCLNIRTSRRESDAFDKKFQQEQEEKNND